MNGFHDFDTQVQVEEVYDESCMGGQYHGPTNEAGWTSQEYREAMAAWEDERFKW